MMMTTTITTIGGVTAIVRIGIRMVAGRITAIPTAGMCAPRDTMVPTAEWDA
jgi:hypothetical protein